MTIRTTAPLLSRVKFWQLVGLGISGWAALYSVAILSWGASSNVIGHAQGGCFAVTMTLAGLEARRYRKGGSISSDPFDWANGTTTEQLNLTIAHVIRRQDFKTEMPHPTESRMGFGVRAVKRGRTFVFETARWREPVIDLNHVQSTEENRKVILADLAIIVGAGTADEETQQFVKSHSLQLLVGKDLKNVLDAEQLSKRV